MPTLKKHSSNSFLTPSTTPSTHRHPHITDLTATPSTNINKIAGLDAWYGGYGLSSYATTVSEYTSTGSTVYPSLHTYTGHIVDLSAVSTYINATLPLYHSVLGHLEIIPYLTEV